MRNNQDRLGLGVPNENLNASNEAPSSQSLEFIVPTEIVELPSKGLFYGEDHPLHHQETIEIKHMTTKEEDILTNESYIKDGSAIDRLLKSIIVDRRININDILIGDKNAITVAARMYGYGSDYQTKYTCPSCNTTQSVEFDLTEMENVDFEEGLNEFNASLDHEKKLIYFKIPRTKTNLQLRILNETTKQDRKKKNKKGNLVSKFFEKIIYSVNDNSDPGYVKSYITTMSALDSRYLRAAYQKIVPNIDMSCEFECSNCGYEGKVEVPLKAEFFWPK